MHNIYMHILISPPKSLFSDNLYIAYKLTFFLLSAHPI